MGLSVQKLYGELLRVIGIALFTCTFSSAAFAQETRSLAADKAIADTRRDAINKLDPLLTKYCGESCQVIQIDVQVQEIMPEAEDLGFNQTEGSSLSSKFEVERVTAQLQIDDRVTEQNRERLATILGNNLRGFGTHIEIQWHPVTLPQIGRSSAAEEELKQSLEKRVRKAVEDVIDIYCPTTCNLSNLESTGSLISPDQAAGLGNKDLVRSPTGREILRIDNVEVELSIDSKLPESERTQIANLIRTKLRFINPVTVNIHAVDFPESAQAKKAKENAEADDPYGLEKLRRTLILFRDLAGTKEIVTNSSTTTNSNSNSASTSKEHLATNSSTTSAQNSTSESNSNSKSSEATTDNKSISQNGSTDLQQYAIYGGAFLLLFGFIAFILMRFGSAKRDAESMIHAMQMASPIPQPGRTDGNGDSSGGIRTSSNEGSNTGKMGLKLKVEELRQELMQIFIEAPKVAKETFGRILLEDGVETTSHYLHLFGQVVVFELLDDPNMSRDLFELSEFYHKSNHIFTLEEELELLNTLKNKVTANEIRVLTRKTSDKFEFLARLDSNQIFNLIRDESGQVQSIVLTQLDNKRRRAIFELYQGAPKMQLMRELCRADAIPKEFLHNVAAALQKKVRTRPEFDTEQLRSSEILLDLLEKSPIQEQRELMADLESINPESARAIKVKLVTLEMLPYLKSGHLLEIVLGLERIELVRFLSGTREHIRDLLLSNAPAELAESWQEDLSQVAGVDEQNYRLVELKMLGRIRHLANSGAINILEMNEIMFQKSEKRKSDESASKGGISRDRLIA